MKPDIYRRISEFNRFFNECLLIPLTLVFFIWIWIVIPDFRWIILVAGIIFIIITMLLCPMLYLFGIFAIVLWIVEWHKKRRGEL
jgi:glucan phosphoethanolaminetransferase (alkaline phosphatase superfamily)